MWRSRRSAAARGQRQEDPAGDEQHAAPDDVHVDAERSRIDRLIAEQAVAGEQRAHHREHQTGRQTNVEAHQKNTRLSSAVEVSTITPRTAGRVYQTSAE